MTSITDNADNSLKKATPYYTQIIVATYIPKFLQKLVV